MTDEVKPKKSMRGFASMDQARRREIAKMGGAAVPADKRSFSKDRDLASRAGSMGGANGSRGPKEGGE